MTIREATVGDRPVLTGFREAYLDEYWRRPYPSGPWRDEYYDARHILVAEEDGRIVGQADGSIDPNRTGAVHFVYVRTEARGRGVAKALLRELVSWFREQGAEHVTLSVDTSNDAARAVWQRLGFVEYARQLTTPVASLETRVAAAEARESYASVHVQTDDERSVQNAVRRFLPTLGRSRATIVSPPRSGWIALYDELGDRDRRAHRRLAGELSERLGAVAVALAVEEGAVVRMLLFERGRMVDEYLSVPEYYGPLETADALALAANPRLISRLTGADPNDVRAVARTAASPAELPPAPELLVQIGTLLGLEGADHGFANAPEIARAVVVER